MQETLREVLTFVSLVELTEIDKHDPSNPQGRGYKHHDRGDGSDADDVAVPAELPRPGEAPQTRRGCCRMWMVRGAS